MVHVSPILSILSIFISCLFNVFFFFFFFLIGAGPMRACKPSFRKDTSFVFFLVLCLFFSHQHFPPEFLCLCVPIVSLVIRKDLLLHEHSPIIGRREILAAGTSDSQWASNLPQNAYSALCVSLYVIMCQSQRQRKKQQHTKKQNRKCNVGKERTA